MPRQTKRSRQKWQFFFHLDTWTLGNREFKIKAKIDRLRLCLNLSDLKHSKKLGEFDHARLKVYLNFSNNRLSILKGFFNGHCRLGQHFVKLDQEDNDDCRLCREEKELQNT